VPVSPQSLSALRRSLVDLERGFQPAADRTFHPGLPGLEPALAKGALHEVHAARAEDAASAIAFTATLAMQAATTRTLAWVRGDRPHRSAGQLYPPGLAELGLDPARLLLVRPRDAVGVLRATLEAARCPAVGAVLAELWGEVKGFDLTASRRLSLAAVQSGVTVLLARIAARAIPTAAQTRWLVRSIPSVPLEANAPGMPGFGIVLQRHRGGAAEAAWHMEWDRDQQRFRTIPSLSRHLPAVPGDRATLASEFREHLLRAG
jgi:protein ImuA